MRLFSLLVAALALAACSTPSQEGPAKADATGDGSALFDVPKGDGGDGGGKTDTTGDTSGGGFVWLAFEVDDSANKTFADGEIKWTGSFAWDEKTNTIVHATSWLPDEGPYPPLWDDGPLSQGGHEREGATKGDHVFSTQVKLVTDKDYTFEYGALNELDYWMWVGPNGKFEVKAGQSGTVQVPGLKLSKFGQVDIKITLDTAQLNKAYSKWSTKTHKFFVKGTMNQWTPVQLLDDGNKGDDKADDGVLTYVHGKNLGKHDGLVSPSDEVQFIFVATQGDTEPEAGLEYKGSTAAYKDGVSAWASTGTAGSWVSVPVVLAKDSKGKFENTALVVPGAAICTPACPSDQTCQAGVCVPTGGCTPACKDGEVCQDGKCLPKPCEPACKATETCQAGQCVPKACEPACGSGEACVGGTCVAKLTITAVEPSKGWTKGGLDVEVLGAGFLTGATVEFGGKAGTEVLVSSDGKTLSVKTPDHAAGLVTVVVSNPGGEKAELKDGFFYQEPPKPTALLLPPLQANLTDKDAFTGQILAKVPTVSQAPGATAGLQVALGYGPEKSDPVAKPADWQWIDATFASEDVQKGEETWTAKLPALKEGKYALVGRVTWEGQTVHGDGDGSENGLQIDKLGLLTVVPKPPGSPSLEAIEPVWAAAKGGSQIVLVGENLKVDHKVEIVSTFQGNPKGVATGLTVVAKGLQVTVPSLPPLPADVVLTAAGLPPLKLASALQIVPFDSPKVDGVVGTDWDKYSLAGLNMVETAWGVGKNELMLANAAFDKDNLYFGVQGTVEAGNAIVGYLDIDYGSGTGVNNPVDLKDNAGPVDDAIASVVTAADTKLGLDFAWATVGMASYQAGDDLAKSTGAGWRGLQPADNFPWLQGTVKASQADSGVEAAIPLQVLFPTGVPAQGATILWVVVLVNKDGSAVSNQWLPGQIGQADAKQAVTWGKLTVFPVP